MNRIFFYSADRAVPVKKRNVIKAFVSRVFAEERVPIARISYVFCSDAYLLKINQRFLSHEAYTDIITFPLSGPDQAILAEIYISTDRIKENAKEYGQAYQNELLRVMIHGLLHLCGYNDKTEFEQGKMRAAENHYLNLYRNDFT